MIPEILKRVQRSGYEIFETGVHNPNIIGVRSQSRESNQFDDRLYFVAKNTEKQWYQFCFQITTDPGLYWLNNPGRVAGTAILCPGQYKKVYKLDLHRGKYQALCQRLGKVRCFRDKNRDQFLDMNPDSEADGYYGINIHKAGGYSRNVEKYSAGCQVFAFEKEYDVFISLCELSAHIWGNAFTYTLLED